MTLAILTWALVGWAQILAGATARALWRRPRSPRPAPLPEATPPFVLARPCAGAEEGLVERLTASGAAAPIVRFILADQQDPGIVAAEIAALKLRRLGVDAQIVIHHTHAANRKAAHLAYIADAFPDHALVSADSDVDLGEGDIHALLAALEAGAGAAWSPPTERPRGWSWGDRASAGILDASLHAFPLLQRLDPGCFVGKCFAISPQARAAIGGLAPFEAFLGEDMALGAALRAAGCRVDAVGGVISRPPSRSLRAILERYRRWLLVIRGQRPALLLSYPLFFCAALPIAASGALLGGLGWIAAGVALAARAATGIYGGLGDRRLLDPRIWLLADLVLLWACASALVRAEVEWRGRRLKVIGGRLIASAE